MIWKIKFLIFSELSENLKLRCFDRWPKGLSEGCEPKVELYYENIVSSKYLLFGLY